MHWYMTKHYELDLDCKHEFDRAEMNRCPCASFNGRFAVYGYSRKAMFPFGPFVIGFEQETQARLDELNEIEATRRLRREAPKLVELLKKMIRIGEITGVGRMVANHAIQRATIGFSVEEV